MVGRRCGWGEGTACPRCIGGVRRASLSIVNFLRGDFRDWLLNEPCRIRIHVSEAAESNHLLCTVADEPGFFRSVQTADQRRGDRKFDAAEAQASDLHRSGQKVVEFFEVLIFVQGYRGAVDVGDMDGAVFGELQLQECDRTGLPFRGWGLSQPDRIDRLIAVRSFDGEFFESGDDDVLDAHDFAVEDLRVGKNVANGGVDGLGA